MCRRGTYFPTYKSNCTNQFNSHLQNKFECFLEMFYIKPFHFLMENKIHFLHYKWDAFIHFDPNLYNKLPEILSYHQLSIYYWRRYYRKNDDQFIHYLSHCIDYRIFKLSSIQNSLGFKSQPHDNRIGI